MNAVRLLGIDVGTSGCRAVVIDETGTVLADASAKYPLSRPHPLWSEQDPEDWWRAVRRCISDLESRIADRPLTALALTGQMHGAVFLDQEGQVIRPSILWNDQRTTEECEDIDRIVGKERVREITLNPPLTGFQLPKILWLRKHEPHNFARVRKILLPKDYIRYRLTGEFFTEVTDASGTGIFDVRKRKWSAEMMQALDLDPSLFPECVESTEPTGFCHESLLTDRLPTGHRSMITGHEIPVFAGAGDQAAGAVGTGTVGGTISISLGTSGVVFSSIDSLPSFEARSAITHQTSHIPSASPRSAIEDAVHTFCHANGKWHQMGVMLSCGGALAWYASEIRGLIPEEVLKEAEQAEPGCNGLTFLPYLCGERSPHNDPNARAGFVGLTLSHGTKEMSRAVIEGVTFGLRQCWEVVKIWALSAERIEPELRVTGGGAKSRFWVQIIADVFGLPCETLEVDEGPAFGAALIAGVGAGVWHSLNDACKDCIRTRERFVLSGVEYEESYRRYRELYPHLRTWFNLT